MNSTEDTSVQLNPKEVLDQVVQEPTVVSQTTDSASLPETALSEIEQEIETEGSEPMHSEGICHANK